MTTSDKHSAAPQPVAESAALIGRAILLLLAMLAVSTPAGAKTAILYAGSYTSGTSRGIYAWRFDDRKATLEPLGLMAETSQAAHIWVAPNGRYLYAVNWEEQGGVSAFRIDRASARLTFLNRVSAKGIRPNQVVVDPTGRIAVSVTYNTGNVAAYRVLPDGRLADAFYVDQHAGRPLSPKQPGPKAHGIAFSPDGRALYVADLGLDRLYAYHVDAAKGTIVPADPPYVCTHAGSGPRRLQVAPNGKFLYVNHETDSEVSVFAVDGTHLAELQTIPTLPPGHVGANLTAEIVLSPDDRFLYVSNRGDDSIAVFAVEGATGLLRRLANVPAGGHTPRNLRISPSGGFLFSSNEGSGSITVLRIDVATGLLTLLAARADIDTPAGLSFLKENRAARTNSRQRDLCRIRIKLSSNRIRLKRRQHYDPR